MLWRSRVTRMHSRSWSLRKLPVPWWSNWELATINWFQPLSLSRKAWTMSNANDDWQLLWLKWILHLKLFMLIRRGRTSVGGHTRNAMEEHWAYYRDRRRIWAVWHVSFPKFWLVRRVELSWQTTPRMVVASVIIFVSGHWTRDCSSESYGKFRMGHSFAKRPSH